MAPLAGIDEVYPMPKLEVLNPLSNLVHILKSAPYSRMMLASIEDITRDNEHLFKYQLGLGKVNAGG